MQRGLIRGQHTSTIERHAPRSRPIVLLDADFLNTLLCHAITSREEDLCGRAFSRGSHSSIAHQLWR